MPSTRLNLPAIEASLRNVQRDFPRINAQLTTPRDPLGDDVLANMLAGYTYVDRLVIEGIDLFAMGQLKHMLELNALVLCGRDPDQREKYAPHIEATQRKYYEEPEGGIRDLVEWYLGHRHSSVWRRAAGAYVRVLSEPQLFIEGNHRTGALVLSYILLREGHPPFVLSVENAAGYFDPSGVIRHLRRGTLTMLLRLPAIQNHFTEFLRAQANPAFLVTCGPQMTHPPGVPR